jgi:PAS domain S-box-containing protein
MNTITKRFLALLLLICLNAVLAQGCFGGPGAKAFDAASVRSYREIPGVNDEEIAAIELLKSSRTYFSYGSANSSEAFMTEDGTLDGFTVLLCGRLTELFGIPFMAGIYDWDDLIDRLGNRSLDFTGELTPTEERRRVYQMSSPIAQRHLGVYYHKDLSPKIESETDLNGLRIGFLEGTITLGQVRQAYRNLEFEAVNAINLPEAARMLSLGEIDAFIEEAVDSFFVQGFDFIEFADVLPLIYNPLSLTATNPELWPIVSVMDRYIAAGGVDRLYELYKEGGDRYARYKLGRSLSDNETAYIASLSAGGAAVRVALESDNYPISFYDDKQKEFHGIAPDILAEVSRLTGIRFEVATDKNTTWSEIVENLRTGSVALVSELQYSEEREKDFIWTGEPYLTSHYAFLSKQDYPNVEFYRVERATVGVVRDSAHEELYDMWIPGNSNTKRYDTQFEALDALETGEIDLFMSSDYMLLTQMNYREKPGYKANYTFTAPIEKSFFGFNKDEEELCSIIGKVQHYIKTDKIVTEWASRVYDYSKKLAENRVIYLTVFAIVFLLMLFILASVFLQSVRRNRMVKKQSALLKAIYDALPDTIICKDMNSTYTSCNHAFLKMTGRSESDIIGKTSSEVFTEQPEVARKLEEADNVILTGGMVSKAESWFTFQDKTRRLYETVRTPIIEGKKRVGVVGLSRDITESFAFTSTLENILGSINSMIYVTMPDTCEILFMNDRMKEHFGIEGKVEGQICYELLQKDISHKCDFCPCYQLDKEPGAVVEWEEHNTVTNRAYHNTDTYIDWPGKGKVHLQHSVDITELVAARELAEQSNRSKGVFIAQMSHEIRTPMSAILGIAEIHLRDEGLSAGAEEGFRRIYDSGNLLLNIINDILDFSKIDAGKMEIVPDKYEIPSLVNDTAQLYLLRFESKHIEFIPQVDENTPLELIGDELRIKQILSNLLSNAFKYTDTGEVRLTVASAPGNDDETVTLILKVSDTGQGMSKDQIGRIFDEYSRFNRELNNGIPGTGLGMSITNRLVDMMRGEIFVESEVGKGSVFTVRLPQKIWGTAVCGAEVVENLRNFTYSDTSISKKAQILYEHMPYGRVLVVDDVESNLYVAKGLLAAYGLYIETAKSGFEAIQKIKDGGVYDIVFMDHMMPVMDGIKAAEIIRDMGYTHPIVALTANAISGQAERFLSNGFDRFISKPIDSRELDLVLKELIRDRKPPEILEAARREEETAVRPGDGLSELNRYFIKDAEGVISVLEGICAKTDALDDADMQSYTIAVHGIKSALANVDEARLSEFADLLEKAGVAGDSGVVAGETPAFIHKLKVLIEKIKPKYVSGAVEISRDDMLYLKEKLSGLRAACETFNIRAAEAVLSGLEQKTWPPEIDDAIVEISVGLLRGEFKEVILIAERIADMTGH